MVANYIVNFICFILIDRNDFDQFDRVLGIIHSVVVSELHPNLHFVGVYYLFSFGWRVTVLLIVNEHSMVASY